MTDSKLILIRENNKILSLLLSAGKLIEVSAFPVPGRNAVSEKGAGYAEKSELQPAGFSLGSIYVGKVKNVVKNINAAFVELAPGRNAFLPLEDLNHSSHGSSCQARLLNRSYDGRILSGDELLVQIEREAVKTKDPVLTTRISLSGRYAVVEADSQAGKKLHFSNKLSASVKNAIQSHLYRDVPHTGQADSLQESNTSACDALESVLQTCSVIIRTNAAELQDLDVLTDEIISLGTKLQRICETAGSRTCYSCLYQPVSPWLSEIRDTYSSQYDEIVTDDRSLYEELHSYLAESYPEELASLRFYQDERLSLKNLYGLGAKLKEATEPRIWLRSGGYLVIEPTEALTVIDVNSGKFAGKKGTSETWKLLNREAAEEIARQLRLRNFSGIIIADFINMDSKADEEDLLRYLASELKKDPVKASVVDMTPLGLVEITRKKVRRSLKEQLEA